LTTSESEMKYHSFRVQSILDSLSMKPFGLQKEISVKMWCNCHTL